MNRERFLKLVRSLHSWLYLSVILIALNFVYRLVDYSHIIYYFPLDQVNDVSSYMAQLFFLKVCGFHQFCPYWYNGFITFQSTPPAWFFFTLPFYYLFGDVKIATYVSMLTIFILSFIILYYCGKKIGFSRKQRSMFFFLFFGNAIAIGNLIRLGRVHELFAWLWFIPFFFTLYYFIDRPLNKWFALNSILFFTLLILSYHPVALLASFLLLGFIIVRQEFNEKIVIITCIIGAFVLSSFWIVPYINSFSKNQSSSFNLSTWILNFEGKNIASIHIAAVLIPGAAIVLFLYLWKTKISSHKEVLFFLPSMTLATLLLLRIVALVPFLDDIPLDVYFLFFIFITLFLFIKTESSRDNDKNRIQCKQYICALVLIASMASVLYSMFVTPYFSIPDERDHEIISLLPLVEGNYLSGPDPQSHTYGKALAAYGAIYYNLSSITGWYPHLKGKEYFEELAKLKESRATRNCTEFTATFRALNGTSYLAYDDECSFVQSCRMTEVARKGRVCLYKIT